MERGFVEKSGSHFALDGERIGQGRERAIEWLKANPAVLQRLLEKLMERPAADPTPLCLLA